MQDPEGMNKRTMNEKTMTNGVIEEKKRKDGKGNASS